MAKLLCAVLVEALSQRRRSRPHSRPCRHSPRISLDDAVRLAQKNEPVFAAARAQARIARLDHSVAVAGLLPSVTYHNQYLFTQGNGSNDRIGQTTTSPAPRFIANNAVHEYASQGVVNERLGLQQFSAVSWPARRRRRRRRKRRLRGAAWSPRWSRFTTAWPRPIPSSL